MKNRLLLCLLAVALVAPAAGAAASALLPRPAGIEPNVQFWIRIYSEIPSDAGLIHDARELGRVYEQISVPASLSRRTRDRETGRARDRYVSILRKLAAGKRTGLGKEEARVLALFPPGVSNEALKKASREVRFQRGLSDRFRAGVIRSGHWRSHIEDTFREAGLPVELAALPHVESSYNPEAYSHVGAAGLWQFMRGTGRRFMRVDHVVDERMDPHRATLAAARLLEANYQVTGSWPLAITAYNHGAAGMRRAVRKLGTDDIATIVRDYRSRSFGFASRNFYSEFLAALEVDRNAERYFGRLVLETPIEYEEIVLPFYTSASSLHKALGVPLQTLREANPSLRPMVWAGDKRIPKNFALRLQRIHAKRPLGDMVAAVPHSDRYAAQTRDRNVRVNRGDTLSGIASRYGTNVRELMAINNLKSSHRIRVGQLLNLPNDANGRRGPAPVEQAEPPEDGVYLVQSGDTISTIAKRFDISEHELVRRNRLHSRHRISIGQALHVGDAPQNVALAAPTQAPQTVAQVAPAVAATPAPGVPTPGAIPKPVAIAVASSATGTDATGLLSADSSAEAAARLPSDAGNIELANADADEMEVLEDLDLDVDDSGQLDLRDGADDDAGIELAAENPASIRPGSDLPLTTDAATALAAEDAMATVDLPATLPATIDETVLTQEALLADPTDYSVGTDGSVEVQATETLGHIAEWLDVRASQIRHLNGLRYGQPIRVARRLRLDFSNVSRELFLERRLQHHRAIQAAFFEQFEIAGTDIHIVRRGDSIWVLSRDSQVPLWLMRQYNPDIDFATLDPGTKLTLPRLRPHGLPADDPTQPT